MREIYGREYSGLGMKMSRVGKGNGNWNWYMGMGGITKPFADL